MEAGERRLVARLSAPVDPAGLAVFRALLGLVLFGSALRFLAKGWVRELYVAPRFHFTYLGFDWVAPWPQPWMTIHVVALALLGAAIALGICTRAAAALHALAFTYVELIDASLYLNHYYLSSLLSLLLVVVPSDATWSVAAWWRRRRAEPAPPVRLAHYALLRAQLGIVYGFAGLAKLNGDWLLHALPLRIWLRQFWSVPLLGPVFAWPGSAYAMSWFGAAFDLGIALAISSRRLRPAAWCLAAVFHVTIGLLFPIGVFSFVMLAALTCFNEPGWPRRFLPVSVFTEVTSTRADGPISSWFLAFSTVFLAVQLLVPARFLLYPGRVNWTEQGFRFAWRVMLIEKTGHVEFFVRASDPPLRLALDGRHELTPLQLRMMSTQPDMIHQYAQHLAEVVRHEYGVRGRVEVRADAWVAFNGRRSQRLLDPTVDLAREPRGVGAAPWILPLESR